MPHDDSPFNMPVKRGLSEDVLLPITKRLHAAMETITIDNDDEEPAMRYASPRPPWPPRGPSHVKGSQEDASLRTDQQASEQAAQSESLTSLMKGREYKAYISELEQKVRDLEGQVADLNKDVSERQILYKEAFQQQEHEERQKGDDDTDLQAQFDQLLKENKKLKKSAKSERRTLIAERNELQEQLDEANKLILKDQAQLEASQEGYSELLAQKQKMEKEFKKRGEGIIKLTRDLKTTTPSSSAISTPTTVHKSATASNPNSASTVVAQRKSKREGRDDSKHILLTRLGGMFAHYRTLFEKNEALVEKLMNMAKAGGFGHHSSLYRKEVENLRGADLEDLDEFKRHIG